MKKYILFAAALTVLAACNKDDNQPEGSSPVEIRLTSSLEAQTRATHDLDTKIAENETVYVWVDDAGTNAALYTNNALTVGSDGALSGGTAMYFPSSGNGVDIYAIHGNLSSTSSFWNQSITHTVATDQQTSVTDAAAGYAVSDLVYCKSADVARTTSAVTLTFTHLLSKIEVVLKQGNGAPVVAKAEIINTQLEATFTPAKTDDGITVTASGSTGENAITIDCGVTTSTDVLNEAIIVPQTIAGGTKFIRITTDQGGELYYTIPTAGVTFEAGYKYRYTITVNLTGLEVTSEITNWNDGGEVDSTATM